MKEVIYLFGALEEPDIDESALIVSIAMPPDRVVDTIAERLALATHPGDA